MRRPLGLYFPAWPHAAMPDYVIDAKTYDKARSYAVGHGYGMRTAPPTTGVIHTTNNRTPNTAFAGECKYLFESADVSAHFLISKSGQIVQFLDPTVHVAWHAGGRQSSGVWTAMPAFANPASWGVELHVSVGEAPTHAQKDAAAWLCRGLMAHFGMTLHLIETHRAIALPPGRKSDPEGWPDADFYAWRAALVQPPRRRFRLTGWPIYQAQSLTGTLAGHVQSGEVVEIDQVYSNGGGHLASGLGFIDLNHDALEELP